MNSKLSAVTLFLISLISSNALSQHQGASGENQASNSSNPSSVLSDADASKLKCSDINYTNPYSLELNLKKSINLPPSKNGKPQRFFIRDGQLVETSQKENATAPFCELQYQGPYSKRKEAFQLKSGRHTMPEKIVATIAGYKDLQNRPTAGCRINLIFKRSPDGNFREIENLALQCEFLESKGKEPRLGQMMESLKNFAEIKVTK